MRMMAQRESRPIFPARPRPSLARGTETLLDLIASAGALLLRVAGGERGARAGSRAEVSRDIRIEDLLGRDSVQLDEEVIGRCLTGRRIMVTGAGGSIGSELVRQIARFRPRRLLLVERSESALFQIHSEMDGRGRESESAVVPLLVDLNDAERVRAAFAEHRPQVVLHAAAHKHVPLAESNVAEVVRNNALATNRVGELAGEHGAQVFVLISTDKAVNPVSVMGASKRVAELAVQNLNRRFRGTRYLAVRFGNVIGSAGSVIPIFQEQIRRGGPVTVTDERMERYFMTIPEAAQLVLQAGTMGRGGEIFTLKMGAPVRIYDLARDMIVRSGLRPGRDIEIEITGARPGEKLFEELFTGGERHDRTRHPRILVGKIPAYPPARVSAALARLERLVRQGDSRQLREYLNTLLPEAKLDVSPGRETDVAPERETDDVRERETDVMRERETGVAAGRESEDAPGRETRGALVRAATSPAPLAAQANFGGHT
jgi:FlaA1/EpsC-like NDP-sugar epimerase